MRADSIFPWKQTAPGAGYYEVTLSDKSGFGLDYVVARAEKTVPRKKACPCSEKS